MSDLNDSQQDMNKNPDSRKIEVSFSDKELINHVSRLIKEQVRLSWKKKLLIALVPTITFIVGMGTISAAMWADTHDRRQRAVIQQLDFKAERLRDEKEAKVNLQREFNQAGTEMRATRNLEVVACNLGLRNTPQEKFHFIQMRMKARANMADTIYATISSVFSDVPGITAEARKVTAFDESIKDVCKGPPEKMWQSLQLNVSNKMKDSIERTNEEIKSVETILEKRLSN